jgi:AraC-like DNA-binding protein
MAHRISTLDVPPRDRLSYWREVATRAFVSHEFDSPSGREFLAVLSSGWLGSLGASMFECDPCRATRTARHVAQDDCDDLLLCVHIGGEAAFEQDGRQQVHTPGGMLLLDARHPFTCVYAGNAQSMTFKISRPDLECRVGDVSPLTARAVGSVAVSGLASGFLSMLPVRLGAVNEDARAKLGEQALDLVALAFTAELQLRGLTLASPRATALLRLKAAIEARLSDTQLKPAAAATAAAISVRYANDLLSEEGRSVERYIQHRRLERCRRALEDPAQAHRSVGEIAFGWGFSNLSHFVRRFRAAYGCSPGEHRRRVLHATH